MTEYKIIIYWSEEDQTYIAEVPELAGCMADGSGYQEAVSNAERVIAKWMDTAVELGRDIPDPKGGCMLKLYRHCCSFASKHPVGVVCIIVLIVLGFYFFNFHNGLSKGNGDWGTFGDYFGGILNPVIAAFAFYLIARTYELQKTELEETRKLLKVSTDAQNDQVKLAALTALLNSNLTRISLLESERIKLIQQQETAGSIKYKPDDYMAQPQRETLSEIRGLLIENNGKICELKEETNKLEKQIKDFLNKETE
jgi:predicted RNase H-like HicB family nuclease